MLARKKKRDENWVTCQIRRACSEHKVLASPRTHYRALATFAEFYLYEEMQRSPVKNKHRIYSTLTL